MNWLGLIILVAVFSVIISARRFFKQQKKICQKYPFYKLRDEIALKIATSDEYEKYLEIYETVNRAISRLRYFNFSFYAEMMTITISNILEKAYVNNSENNFEFDDEALKQIRDVKIPSFQKQFVDLILNTAKENSLLLRVSMTKYCYKFLFATQAFKSIVRFLRKHPEIFKNHRDPVRTARDYSYVNHLVGGVKFS